MTKVEDRTATASDPFADLSLPPVSPTVLAAYRHMWRAPHLFDGYEEGTWVAFSGEEIVAAAANLAGLHRLLDEIGQADVFIVPVSPGHF